MTCKSDPWVLCLFPSVHIAVTFLSDYTCLQQQYMRQTEFGIPSILPWVPEENDLRLYLAQVTAVHFVEQCIAATQASAAPLRLQRSLSAGSMPTLGQAFNIRTSGPSCTNSSEAPIAAIGSASSNADEEGGCAVEMEVANLADVALQVIAIIPQMLGLFHGDAVHKSV